MLVVYAQSQMQQSNVRCNHVLKDIMGIAYG